MEKSIYLDIDLCVGCGACSVACMDQNDVYPEKGQTAFRRIYQVEEGQFPNASIMYVSAACMHCEDAPCVMGCPTGAITKDGSTGVVGVNRALCIGCHSCAMACPSASPGTTRKRRCISAICARDACKPDYSRPVCASARPAPLASNPQIVCKPEEKTISPPPS